MKRILTIICVFFVLLGTLFAGWERKQVLGDFSDAINVYAYDKSNIFVNTVDGYFYLSNDNGDTWKIINALKPDNGNRSIILRDSIILFTDTYYVYKSVDLGKTWVKMIQYFMNHCSNCAIEFANDKIYYGGEKSVYVTSDFGASWSLLLPTEVGESITNIKVLGPVILVAINNNKFKISVKNGKDWSDIDSGLSSDVLNSYSMDISKFNTNFIIHDRNSIYVTNNDYHRWQLIYQAKDFIDTNGIHNFSYINSLNICNNTIFANTFTPSDTGFIYSTDMGKLWITYNEGLILSERDGHFQMYNNGEYIISHSGPYLLRHRLKDCIPDTMNTCVIENHDDLFSLSPNPATDFLEISVGANGVRPEQNIEIFSVLGEKVLIVGAKGPSPIQIDVSSLPQGIYFVKVGDKVGKFVKL